VRFLRFSCLYISEKVGRRRLLLVFTLATAAAATVLILTNNVLILTAFTFLGILSGVGGGGGSQATQPLEQARLVDAALAYKHEQTCLPSTV